MTAKKNKQKADIQKSVNRLEEIIKYFEKEDSEFDLDMGLAYYEEAMELVHKIKKELEAVELKINEIQAKYSTEEEQEFAAS